MSLQILAQSRFFKDKKKGYRTAPKGKTLRKLLRKEGIRLAYPPTFKKKFGSNVSFTESDPACFELNQQDGRVKLPKIGWAKCRYPREIVAKPNSITVKFDGRHWIFSVQTRQEVPDPVHPNNPPCKSTKPVSEMLARRVLGDLNIKEISASASKIIPLTGQKDV